MLRVTHISFFLDPLRREPERLLHDWATLVDVAEAAAQGGARVSVIQASAQTRQLTRNDVDYRFAAPDEPTSSIATGRGFPALLRDLDAHVFHVHGLGFPADLLSLAALAPNVPVIVQDHADHPPRLWRRRAWRRGLAVVSGVAFCSAAQAQPFVRARLLPASVAIHEIPESTSRFTPGDRAQARASTGLHGNPCVLWVGHLNVNKDPLTVLDGVRAAVRELPGLQLWCCYGDAPLLAEVKRRIDADAVLRPRVHLLGRAPHDQIQQFMRASDSFVLGSHHEGSGYALIEAMACGLSPVVTDIPSFRALTGQGTAGRLWACGDSRALCRALVAIGTPSPGVRQSVRAHFDAELSFAAVGRKLCAAYQQAGSRASKPAAAMV